MARGVVFCIQKYIFSVIYFNILFYSFFCSFRVNGQDVNYSVYANIVYRLTKYMEWPNQSQGYFEIGIIGESDLNSELKTLTTGKNVLNKPIKIVSYSGDEESFPCSILFITTDESYLLKSVLQAVGNNPVVIITEKKGLIMKGSGLNFIVVNDHLEMELNKSDIQRRNIKIATEFIGLCKIIN